MARTPLTVAIMGSDLTTVTKSATAGTADGHQFDSMGNEWVFLQETGDAATCDVTFKEQRAEGWITDQVVTVPISGTAFVGPFARSIFRVGGVVQIDFEAGKEADMDVQVVRFFPTLS